MYFLDFTHFTGLFVSMNEVIVYFLLELASISLQNLPPGSFVVRDSQTFEGGFGLAVKVETPPSCVLQQTGVGISELYYSF